MRNNLSLPFKLPSYSRLRLVFFFPLFRNSIEQKHTQTTYLDHIEVMEQKKNANVATVWHISFEVETNQTEEWLS